MMKKIVIAVIVVVLIAGGVYFFLKKPSLNYNYGAKTPTQTASSVAADQNTVNISNFAFVPETLTVKKGTTVTWVNQDSVAHQIKSDTFNSVSLNQGDKYSFTFSTAGTFNYSCAVHPTMTGKIVVQ